ncbi:ATP-binding protein [[Enterobacter] lignolyticus]|uniref:Anti-sigma regulatory factor, serine/threonine protein kinase n=3 Tax=[Enterobacter] lignolyticus TaxID=1334193 RepID=E3GAJ7_ENTLS|nr:ATP-binding protein [[Enterobacter] lignolyticus]ADO48830.1 putative anti-sigma regulatory factor, serine/threonine protein kinase [[Enterobacter] lignolyticus SCF1]ALR76488.1 serine/threonine protein kinase [[Enterobacter] lignolyticus]
MEKVNTVFRLPTSLENLETLSSAIRQFIAQLELDPAVVYQLELATCEAFSNIVRHGVNHDPEQSVGVTLSYADGGVEIVLSDSGKPIPQAILRALAGRDKSLPEPDPHRQASWPESGIGLKLIFAMMDDVSYRSQEGRNELILIKHV